MREALRQARIRLGLTQQQVAERVGISQNYYSEIENGKSCSMAVGLRIAEILGVDPRVLFADLADEARKKSA